MECDNLEIIGGAAFNGCTSLRSINLPSARILGNWAFFFCKALVDVKFGGELERFDQKVFGGCPKLERITIPLKDGLFPMDDVFMKCDKLKRVDLVESARAVLHETVAALQLEEWRNDMKAEIDSINQILLNAPAGGWIDGIRDIGEKAHTTRRWIRSVLDKIGHYQAEHHRLLDEAAATVQFALPADIVMNNVLPFLALPPYTFEYIRRR